MKRFLIPFSIATVLNAQAPPFDANGGYLGATVSARAKGLEVGIGLPGSCDGPILSSRIVVQKVEDQGSLRASVCIGAGLFAPRWYLHGGPVIAHDPVHGGEGGVAAWGAFLLTPSIYAGLDARALWAKRAVEHQVTLSLGWHF